MGRINQIQWITPEPYLPPGFDSARHYITG
jgi:hypothetical protein